MLHMKHRHVLMDGDLEPLRGSGRQQRVKLRKVQIVRGGDSFESETVPAIVSAQPVGYVQRKVPDAPVVGKKVEVIVVADQVAVGLASANLLERPFLA